MKVGRYGILNIIVYRFMILYSIPTSCVYSVCAVLRRCTIHKTVPMCILYETTYNKRHAWDSNVFIIQGDSPSIPDDHPL